MEGLLSPSNSTPNFRLVATPGKSNIRGVATTSRPTMPISHLPTSPVRPDLLVWSAAQILARQISRLAHERRAAALMLCWLLGHFCAQAAPSQVLNGPLPIGGNVLSYQFSSDGLRIFYIAEQTKDGVAEFYSVPISGGTPAKLNAPLVTGGNVVAFTLTTSGFPLYIADGGADEVFELYRTNTTSNTNVLKVSGTLVAGGDVTSVQEVYDFNSDKYYAFYRADQTTDEVFALYRVDYLNATAPTTVASPSPAGGDVVSFQISPDRNRVVYLMDSPTDDVFELYSTLVTGGGTTKLSATLVTGGDVVAFQISPDGKHVAYVADRTVDEQFELYRVPIDGGTSDKLSGTLPPGGDVTTFQFSPDSKRVLYLADQNTDDVFELFSASVTDASNVKLNGSLVPGGDVSAFQISADSTRVVYLADQATDGTNELFSVAASGGAAIKLNAALPAGGNVSSFQLSPDSLSALYIADQATDELFELYQVAIGGGTPLKVNAPLQANGDVASVLIRATSSQAIYRADLAADEAFEIFSVHLPSRWKSAGGAWDTAANWQSGLPDATADAIIESPAVVTATSGASAREVYSLTLGGGAQTSTLALQSDAVVSALQGLTLLNGGILAGDGTMSTGGFGLSVPSGAEINTIAGERLHMTSGPVANAGRVEALGNAFASAEIDFSGAVTNQNGTGLITGHDATLEFTNGLTNQGSLVFSNGLNDVFGDIANAASPQGRIVVTGGATATFYDDVTNSGSVQVSSVGSLQSAVVFLGTFSGNGVSGGGLVFLEGDTRPGFSPGTMSFGGDVSHGPQAVLHVEIAGPTRGAQYDRLAVAGRLSLAGTLDVTFINGFVPAAGMSFDIWDAASASGGFDTVHLPALPAGLFWRTGRLNVEGVLTIGVTPDNYAAFASYHGLTTPAQGDQEGDGLRNDLEYALGLNPKLPTGLAGLPAVVKSGSNDLVSFSMPSLSSPDVELKIESSTDLLNWSPLATRTGEAAWTGPVAVAPAAAGFDTVTLTRPSPGEAKRFYRLSTRLLP